MDRRNFFKIVSTVSAGAATIACESKKSDALIPLLVPDHEIVPGEEQWHPSICGGCEAGCATIVRVMRAERVIERGGQKFREPIAAIKKIEGNPLDSVTGGRLCARGHAQLQSLYNPDRLREPMRRSGPRGLAQFTAISWDEALASVSEKLRAASPSKILFLTSAQPGTRSLTIQRFLAALGAPPAVSSSLGSLTLERKAAERVFGWKGLPRYDIANARYVLGVGADFLGGWASPVFYARQYGHFRQGRPGLRGQLVQAESRMSLTAASADEWLPILPGSEPQFLVAIARILMDEKLARAVVDIPDANLDQLIHATGIPEKRLRRIARELGESEAPLVLAGASSVHTNSLEALVASHHLNLLLGNVGHPGGLLPPNSSELHTLQDADISKAQLLFLDGENPHYTNPGMNLSSIETIISFGNFLDDSAALADLLLPDHHILETEAAVMPPVSGTSVAIAVAQPFVRPLHNTRPLAQTLTDIAHQLNVPFTPVSAQNVVEPLLKEGETWNAVALQGGLWRDDNSPPANLKPLTTTLEWPAANFTGDPNRFPLQFQPYLSLQYHDGRGANLPWMQELPDPASSSMWGLPVEIDLKTAALLEISTGDWVRVESTQGSLQAQAYVHPAALPGVVSMAIGDGHTHYGRYASQRGANPLTLGVTRVRVEKVNAKAAALTQFSPNDREQGPWGYR
jgi:anaerobic selenocysteine-containing dehydrogenase